MYEEVKISHQSHKTEGLRFLLGFLLLSMLIGMSNHEVPQPQCFLVSFQSWWYKAMIVCICLRQESDLSPSTLLIGRTAFGAFVEFLLKNKTFYAP